MKMRMGTPPEITENPILYGAVMETTTGIFMQTPWFENPKDLLAYAELYKGEFRTTMARRGGETASLNWN